MKISPEILNLVPYKPGKPISETQREYGLKTVYKLASNENPLGTSPKALEAVRNALDHQNLYPDPSHYELLQTISKLWGFPTQQLAVGNGSDELIDLLTRIFCEPKEGVLTSVAAFNAYEVSAAANRATIRKVPLEPGYRFDMKGIADYFFAHPEQNIRLIFISNPNNPTGTYATKQEVEDFLERVGNRDDVMVVFDEAYNEFVRATDYVSAQNYLGKYKNLIVLRTFSKIYGLAGFRIGAMIAPTEVVEVFNRVRKPFNVNDLAQVAANAALQDKEFIERSQQICWKGLDYFYKKLEELGLPYIPSQGNFVMFDTLRDAAKVNEALLRRGIIMRPILNYGFKTHMRVSVGLDNENEAAMNALADVLKEIPLFEKQ
ncbi:histidinol-phosphate transaminase [Bdellovibrio svalbardensis]|uniref:Histidinol-phosphate aminotransferase n=1 Tax=Bdellovibrio svalbardensis TaxID=2972972 RepID=A0ABT6DM25_9BACT|nr:histidinol-phosphate transaminase [Bdellovibrio svalbardensis]MDG0817932.1 histidinol-phosphate transaminase [Bdellovibrio svalbardensis]